MTGLTDIARMRPSPIRRMFELAQGRENVVNLALGEPDFETPGSVRDAAIAAINRGETHYTPNAGLPVLKTAIAKHQLEYDKVPYDPGTEIMVTASAMEALYLLTLAVISEGDEYILSDPCYVNYYDQIRYRHATPVSVGVREANAFNFDPGDVRRAITPRTRAILLNSPMNPTGAVATSEVLEEISAIAIEHDLLVVSDEVYKYFVYDGLEFRSIAALPGMRERTIVIDSFSKTYAMTGWRVGYLAGPSAIVSRMARIQENILCCVPAFTQLAAVEALENGLPEVLRMTAEYRRRRDRLCAGINAIPGISCLVPGGAFYVFVNIRDTGLTSDQFAMRLLERTGVVVAPGSGFGESGEGFVRLSYGTSMANLDEALHRLERFAAGNFE